MPVIRCGHDVERNLWGLYVREDGGTEGKGKERTRCKKKIEVKDIGDEKRIR